MNAAQTVIAPTTDAWPRTLMVVTEPPADLQPPLLLTFVQNSPREQYQLWSWSRLFPGAQMPATAQPEVGSALLPVDADTLAVPPADVLARYADVLTNGAASPHVAEFADACERAGITFIGPPASAMRQLGSKPAARAKMSAAGVPVVPGANCDSAEEAAQAAAKIGFPVLLKAANGGGGKGMRLVHSAEEMKSAWERTRSEAKKFFGDDLVYLRRAQPQPQPPSK